MFVSVFGHDFPFRHLMLQPCMFSCYGVVLCSDMISHSDIFCYSLARSVAIVSLLCLLRVPGNCIIFGGSTRSSTAKRPGQPCGYRGDALNKFL